MKTDLVLNCSSLKNGKIGKTPKLSNARLAVNVRGYDCDRNPAIVHFVPVKPFKCRDTVAQQQSDSGPSQTNLARYRNRWLKSRSSLEASCNANDVYDIRCRLDLTDPQSLWGSTNFLTLIVVNYRKWVLRTAALNLPHIYYAPNLSAFKHRYKLV